jgi:phospholipase/carboxylesterase
MRGNMLQIVEINPPFPPQASIIWLHGLGANGYDFVDLVPQLNLPKELGIRFVFPHAPIRPVTYEQGSKMRAWFDVIKLDGCTETEDKLGILTSAKLIDELIAQEIANNIPSNKIFLVGFSQGGAMALQCGLRYQETLAGILVLSAWLPLATTISELNPANKNTPILLLHGLHDKIIPLSWATKSYTQLKELGCNTNMLTYPIEHSVSPKEISDISKWLHELLENN